MHQQRCACHRGDGQQPEVTEVATGVAMVAAMVAAMGEAAMEVVWAEARREAVEMEVAVMGVVTSAVREVGRAVVARVEAERA